MDLKSCQRIENVNDFNRQTYTSINCLSMNNSLVNNPKEELKSIIYNNENKISNLIENIETKIKCN